MNARTEAPTPHRLEEARKRGEFARSPSVGALASILGCVSGVALSMERAGAQTRAFAGDAWSLQLRTGDALASATRCLSWWIVPATAGALVGAFVFGVAQAGWRPEAGILVPDWSRLSPIHGFRRLVSVVPVGALARASGFALVVVSVWESIARASVADLLRAASSDASGIAAIAAGTLASFASRLLPCSLAWCSLEYGLARHGHFKKLRMTREEVKREVRESEGDPVIKGQRRAIHRALAQGGPARGLGQAQVVVVNPTHLAVALRYAPGECEAPYVVARGREREALALRIEAEERGIPVIRDIPLARGLIGLDLGEEVPEELYQAAAAVLKVAQEGAVR